MLKKVREFFWPVLENLSAYERKMARAEEIKEINQIKALRLAKNVDSALVTARAIYSEENERSRSADNKAFQYLLVVAAITSVLTYFEFAIEGGKVGSTPKWVSLLLVLAAVIYLVWAARWALKAVSVRSYHVIGVQDVVRILQLGSTKTQLVREILIATRRNYEAVNSKVSSVKMAAAFLVRAITAFGIFFLIQTSWEIVTLLYPLIEPFWYSFYALLC